MQLGKQSGNSQGNALNQQGASKGGSSAKRMSCWYNHFKDLLGKSRKTPENSTLPMETISDTLNI